MKTLSIKTLMTILVFCSFLLPACNEDTTIVRKEIKVEELTAEPGAITVAVGGVRAIRAKVVPQGANQMIYWKSADPEIAEVANGIIMGITQGNTTVTVYSVEDMTAYAEISVTVVPAAVTIEEILFGDAPFLTIYLDDGPVQLSYQIMPADAANQGLLLWKNSNPEVATVSETGLITPLTRGTTTVTVFAASNINAIATLDVTIVDRSIPDVPVDKIILSDSRITIAPEVNHTVKANVLPSDATNKGITWSSDNESVARVTGGVITGVNTGTAVITAESLENPDIKTTVKVNVIAPNGLWLFSDPTDIGKATTGNDLTPVKRAGEDGEITYLDGGRINVPHSSYLICNHGIAPTDDDGTVKIFTMLIDFAIPAPLTQWRVFYWAKPETATRDGGLYYSGGSYKVGLNSYATTVTTADTWYRLVIHYSGDNTTHIYINGAKELATTPTTAYTDVHRALASEIWFFTDGYVRTGTMYDYPINVSTIAIWDRILSDAEIAALGGADY